MMIKRIYALMIAGMMGLGTLVHAQEQDVPAATELKAEDVSQGLVVSFVNAMIVVEKVREAYLEEINKAEDEERVNSLIAEADKVAMEAVEKVRGISPGEYVAMARLLSEDAELQGRISARVAELRETQKVQVLTPSETTEDQ